jgi:hypothetical protein
MPAFLIQIIVGLVLTIASTLIQQAFVPKAKTTQAGFRGTLQTGGDVPMSFVVGTHGLAGKLEYANTFGTSGGTPNAFLTQVISFSDLPCHDFISLFVNSEEVTIEASGHTSLGYPVPEKANGAHDNLWWEFYDGSQTSAPTLLTTKFGSDADRPWTSGMIGRGIAYVTLTARLDRKIWTTIPSFMLEVQGIPLYDPRKDSTAGGSGSQRVDDDSTWTWSDNPVVIIYNILIGIRYAGEWVWGMQDEVDPSRLPYANWAAAMNVCDQDIDLKAGGTQKRFRAGRSIGVDEMPVDVINEFLVGCTGRMSEAAGQYTIVVGDPGSASFSFTDSDIITTDPQTLEPFPGMDEVINGATATYLERNQAWESKETAPYLNSTYEDADDGRRQLAGLTLNTVFDPKMAQRILKATVKDNRRFARHVVTLPPQFSIYRPLGVGEWSSVRNGYWDKAFLVTAAAEAENASVVVGLQEVGPSDHDWTPADDEGDVDFAPLTPILPAPQEMTGWSVAPYTFPDSGGTARRVGIEVSYAGGLEDIRAVRIQVREAFGSNRLVFDSGATDYDITDADPVTRAITWAGIIASSDYQARGIFLPPDGVSRDTEWSAWLDVTTPAVSADLSPGSVDLTLLSQDLQNVVGIVTDPSTGGSIPAQIAALVAQMELLAAAVMNVAATTKQRLDILEVSRNGASAAIVRNETAIVTETEARATAIEEVVASFGDSFADGFLVFDALVNVGASTATISAKARAVADGALSLASWQLKASIVGGNPVSSFGIFADRFAIFNDADSSSVAPFSVIGGVPYLNNAVIKDGTLDGGKILNATITGSKIIGGTITGSLLAPLTITGALIANATLTGAKIADAAINSAKIDDLAVGTIKIADGAVSNVLTSNSSGSTTIAWRTTNTTIKSLNVPVTDNFPVIAARVDWETYETGGASISTGNKFTCQLVVVIGGVEQVIEEQSLGGGSALTDPAEVFYFGKPIVPGSNGTYSFRLKFFASATPSSNFRIRLNSIKLEAMYAKK